MRILFIHPNLIHSKPHFGGVTRLRNLIYFMVSRGHTVSLACFVDKWEEKFLKYTEDLRAVCRRMEIVPYPKPGVVRRLLHLIFSCDPNSVLHNYSREMRKRINSIVGDGIDVVHAEFTYMGQYVRYLPRGSFITGINADELNFYSEKLCMEANRWNMRSYLRYKKLKRYELNICRRFDKIFTVTEKEARMLSAALGRKGIGVFPSTVDTSCFTPQDEREEPATLVFLGNFLHTPNVDGIVWFYNNVFTAVKARVPEAKLLIVGAYPPDEVSELGKDSCVEVTGYVEDVRPYIARGSVFICPVRSGGGMRGKLLEALAMEKTCVVTSLGSEGMDMSGQEGLVKADTEADFAETVVRLLKDPAGRQRCGKLGRSVVRQRYDEKITFSKLEKTYEELLRDERGDL